jgi:hypothetical protein
LILIDFSVYGTESRSFLEQIIIDLKILAMVSVMAVFRTITGQIKRDYIAYCMMAGILFAGSVTELYFEGRAFPSALRSKVCSLFEC